MHLPRTPDTERLISEVARWLTEPGRDSAAGIPCRMKMAAYLLPRDQEADPTTLGLQLGRLLGMITAHPPVICTSGSATEIVPIDDENAAFERYAGRWCDLLAPGLAAHDERVLAEVLALLKQLADAGCTRRQTERASPNAASFGDEDPSGDVANYVARLSEDERCLIDALSVLLALTFTPGEPDLEQLELDLFDAPGTDERKPLLGRVFVGVSVSDGVDDGIRNALIDVTNTLVPFLEVDVPQKTPRRSDAELRRKTIERIEAADLVVAIDVHDAPGVATNITTALALVKPVIRLSPRKERRAGSRLVNSGEATGLQHDASVEVDEFARALRIGIGKFAPLILEGALRRARRPIPDSSCWLVRSTNALESWQEWIRYGLESSAFRSVVTLRQATVLAGRSGVPVLDLVAALLSEAAPATGLLGSQPPVEKDDEMDRFAPSRAELSSPQLHHTELAEFARFARSDQGARLKSAELATLLRHAMDTRSAEARLADSSLRHHSWGAFRPWSEAAKKLGFPTDV
ncbi:MAG: hypothetical protein DHS20C19_02150 [Acidimicrobiales bacterium]|nr:MAG: hypothetical protein DHS20C19_02150 [Acidimicrobiales bacterium]